MQNKANKRLASFLVILALLLAMSSCTGGIGVGADTTTGRDDTTAEPSTDSGDTQTADGDAQQTTAPPQNNTVRISFLAAGDNIGHTNVYTDAKNRATDTSLEYNFLPMYNGIRALIDNSDISMINQETIMGGAALSGGKYYGYPDFNSPQDMGRTLVELGFDIVNIANNHMLDWGASGLSKTIDFWKTQPVMLLGGYTDAADYNNIRVYEEKGVRIAFLSYTELINYAHAGEEAGTSLVIPYPDDATIRKQVAAAKQVSDLVIVSMHWGDENVFEASAKQRHVAQLLADCGVDAVIGHHPHVVQEIKWVDRADGGKMLLVYSLGNLLSTMLNGKNMVGGLMTFDILREDGGKPEITAPVFVPTVTHFNMSRRGLQIYLLEDYNETLAAAHGCHADDPGFSYSVACGYVKDHVSAEFLPDFLKS